MRFGVPGLLHSTLGNPVYFYGRARWWARFDVKIGDKLGRWQLIREVTGLSSLDLLITSQEGRGAAPLVLLIAFDLAHKRGR